MTLFLAVVCSGLLRGEPAHVEPDFPSFYIVVSVTAAVKAYQRKPLVHVEIHRVHVARLRFQHQGAEAAPDRQLLGKVDELLSVSLAPQLFACEQFGDEQPLRLEFVLMG